MSVILIPHYRRKVEKDLPGDSSVPLMFKPGSARNIMSQADRASSSTSGDAPFKSGNSIKQNKKRKK